MPNHISDIMSGMFQCAYWCWGGWYIEGVRAWQQATAKTVDDRYAHYFGRHPKR